VSIFIESYRRVKPALPIVLVLVVLLVVRAYVQRNVADGEAPMISSQYLDGSPVLLSSYQGKPVMVHFWATWCGICRLEEQSINNIAKDHAVITIAMQSGEQEEIVEYLTAQGLDFPVISDANASIALTYGVKGVPASFILDADGQIRFIEMGYSTEAGLRFRLWLASWI